MTDKSFFTYKQLIEHLRNHGVVIENENTAVEVLQSRSYYGLINAFKHQYFQKENDKRSDNQIKFNDFVTEYSIENTLKTLLLKYSLLAEIRLKEIVAHRLGEQYGTNIADWLDNSHYRKRCDNATSILNNIRETCSTTDKNPTKYYRENHNSMPPWILITNLTVGQFKNLYSILSPSDRDIVCQKILYKNRITEFEKEYVKSGLNILWEFRNTLAHGSSLLNFSSNTKISIKCTQSVHNTNLVSLTEYKQSHLGSNDILCFIGVLSIFLGEIDKSTFKVELLTLFDSFREDANTNSVFNMYYSGLKLPENLDQRF